MAAETIRNVHINKQDKYEGNFTQADTEALGIAAGKLKLVGIRLYIYLIGNRNNYNFSLSPFAYGRWYGVDYLDEEANKIDESKRSSVNKALREGIKNLTEAGYLKLIVPNNYEFYEFGEQTVPQETNCSSENKQSLREQTVLQVTDSSVKE